ncbi:hypothetical protein ACFQJ5_16640 [Halomicroarcula sp. GCM10025324]|uniref:hypothetical protein n=1 Tax=Haloarcula TaxID=2237 RepID=UPI0023E78C06|nr:hypothetical protein [Halomicroarcula sp. ZS-22-S1]
MPIEMLTGFLSVSLIATLLGLAGIGALALWVFEEREEANDRVDLVERVGERARVTTGGVVGGFGSLAVVVTSIMVTIGQQLAMTGAELAPLFKAAPALTGEILLGLLAYFQIKGYVPLQPWQLGVIVIAVVLVTIVARYGTSESSISRFKGA